VLNRVDCNVLLHDFNTLECGIGQAYLACELLERLIAALPFKKLGQLSSESIAHFDRLRQSISRMWDN